MISWTREVMTPKECHNIRASSGTCSRFLLSSRRACSREFSLSRSAMYCMVRRLSSDMLGLSAAASWWTGFSAFVWFEEELMRL